MTTTVSKGGRDPLSGVDEEEWEEGVKEEEDAEEGGNGNYDEEEVFE